jgi:hypothetical protein
VTLTARPGKHEVLVVVGDRMERRQVDFPREQTVEVR